MKKQMELYVHIPFCERKCAYCDFLSFPADEAVKRRYTEILIGEIEMAGAAYRDTTVTSVFVGGGTPSVLDSGLMVKIFEALHRSFQINGEAEISMEANPGTVTEKKLLDYRSVGINRLSFGLQSADNRELRLLSRIHTFEDFVESFRLARSCGFGNINVDLMSALPGQTTESWLSTLRTVASMEPEHISAYSLIIEEGTPFFDRYGEGRGEGLLPDEDSDREMYHRTKEILAGYGYERYEISNYAKSGRECRHNIGYWTGVPYLGLGLGASSYVDGKRFQVTDNMSEYLNGEPGKCTEEQILTKRDMEEEFFFLGLRMVQGVSLCEFERRFGLSAEQVYPGLLEKLIREGVAEQIGDRFFLTEYGLDVSNCVMAEFLQD